MVGYSLILLFINGKNKYWQRWASGLFGLFYVLLPAIILMAIVYSAVWFFCNA